MNEIPIRMEILRLPSRKKWVRGLVKINSSVATERFIDQLSDNSTHIVFSAFCAMHDLRGCCYPANVLAVPTEDKKVDDLRVSHSRAGWLPMVSTKHDTRERVVLGGVMLPVKKAWGE